LIVLGIDPGSLVTGYSFLKQESRKTVVLEYGVIRTSSTKDLMHRIEQITRSLTSLVLEYKPDVLAMETIFFSKNARSALILGHARGAIMSICAGNEIRFYEYAPRLIKQMVTGKGSASKELVANMMQQHLQLKELPVPEDASDALAVAWTCLIHPETIHD
jgi:crossover junction endodeoxyribonuclease RuvC